MSFNAPAQGTIALIVVTATITAIIAVFGRRFAESLLDSILRPFKWIGEQVYRWVAPRNPLSISLRSYKKHVRRSWLTKIENPIGPELDVPLEHAFAPLKLISSSSQETIDLFSHVSTHERCIVLGGAGTGKTTLMKSLVTRVVNGRANKSLNSLIPVFVVLRKLAAKQQTVKEAVIAAFADFHFPGAEKFVDSALSQGKLLIVLDGLDEVGVNREYVVGQIVSFCESDDQLESRNHVIVTCREYSYRTEDLASVIKNIVRVEPFANHHMRVFLQGWPTYQGRSALALYGLIQKDSQIRDICRNPLLLTILTGLYLETKQFEFPTSRNRFYKEAIDELIIKRPARREIKQKFEPNDKWHVLQRVSLNRLETVSINEDPEELTAEAIREQATAVMRKEIDFNEFIKELVEVNGVIKPTSDGVYTCAHRTIQEYFAANEAGRVRTSQDVVLRFSNRQDLIEVLYFYCGMLRNIPELTKIVESFAEDGRWFEAARCLLSMTEVPASTSVHRVTTELTTQILTGSEFKPVLEILASLAQRPEAEFDPARQRFFEAVNYLAGGDEAQGASALESALATSPEAAMKVIPGLLKHDSERWQIAAVQLLKDIGTEESLDQLVQLLASDKEFIRSQAAKALAGLIKTRNSDLKDRAALLPNRRDSRVWPLEDLFPGSLAIPIAESLSPDEVPVMHNSAISYAASAARLLRSQKNAENTFLRNWKNVARDLRLRTSLARGGALLRRVVYIFSLIVVSVVAGVELWCFKNDKQFLLEVNPMAVHVAERRFTRDMQEKAAQAVAEIEQHLPPNASGLSRILPWNWSVEPLIPESAAEGFASLSEYSKRHFDPYDPAKNEEKLRFLSAIVSNEKFQALEQAAGDLNASLPVLQSSRYLVLDGRVEAIAIVVAMVVLPLFIVRFVNNERYLKSQLLSLFRIIYGTLAPALLPVLYLIGFGVNMTPVWLVWSACLVGFILFSLLLEREQWPKNPLLTAVDDVLPVRDRTDELFLEATLPGAI